MRGRIVLFLILLLSGFWVVIAEAGIARGGGGMRSGVGNRSTAVSQGNIGGGGNISRGNIGGGNINRGDINRQNVQRNVDRTDINRNVNVNRDVDINSGWGRGYYYDDNHWGWGSFAAGAAVGAVGAAAAYDHPDTVVVAPSTGGYVSTLPSDCYATDEGGRPVYNCNGVYYQPTYQGSSLMYEPVQP